jgi:polyhydroxybutyrate depolymerase
MKINSRSSLFYLLAFIFWGQLAQAQVDSIFNQGVWRSFIVHLPTGYNSNQQYPLVLNLHGLNSSASQQQNYTKFNVVADAAKFIVVYPNAVAGSWVINTNSDVNFISSLVDTLRNQYNINNCLFVMGMSQGGFLTYKLACSLPQAIKAIAVVSGNMSQNLQNTCGLSTSLPVMHFHGTADQLVNYNGTAGIPPVTTLIDWWVEHNNCNTTPILDPIPNTVIGDSSTVENYYYYSTASNGSEVSFLKILNGGHTWPGSAPFPPFGFTNQDVQASVLIGNFFLQYCGATSGTSGQTNAVSIQIYPNPADDQLTIETNDNQCFIQLYNAMGALVFKQENVRGTFQLDCTALANGFYTMAVNTGYSRAYKKILIQH